MKAETPKQVLTAMAWMLENVGWCQGHSYDSKRFKRAVTSDLSAKNPPTAMCLRGAWALVEADRQVKLEAWTALSDVTIDGSPIGFNDSPGVTKENVLNLIESAKQQLK